MALIVGSKFSQCNMFTIVNGRTCTFALGPFCTCIKLHSISIMVPILVKKY
jgi:hypothetical protein